MKRRINGALAALAACAALGAPAADEIFQKDGPSSMNGFLAANHPLYVKECGGCHFPYSPGLLPERSWKLQFSRLEKHFGETIQLPPETHAALLAYVTENAADRSPYGGSITFMQRIDPKRTPYRLNDVPLFREMHRVMKEVIDRKQKVKVRTLTNCNACHQAADSGSFGYDELYVPGLSVSRKARD
ncbi:MAG TPA: hypothetical protein VFK48_10865 [Usitatibacter sp.]|nr:hypothetical protein [Usitatibacter sp.]